MLVGACLFEPELGIRSCEIRCEQECPKGFTCQHGFCVLASGTPRKCAELELHVADSLTPFDCEPLEVSLDADAEPDAALRWSAEDLATGLQLRANDRSATLVADAHQFVAGDFVPVVLRVRDQYGNDERHTLDLDFRACTRATTQLEPVCWDEPVAIRLEAEGGFENYTWSLPAGALPGDLELVGDELIGTLSRSDVGSHSFTAQVSDTSAPNDGDAGGGSTLDDEQELTLVVADCLRVDVPDASRVCVGDEYAFELAARGGRAPYAWQVGALPGGLEFDDETHTIKGEVESATRQTIRLTVSDADGETDSYAVSLDVRPCPAMVPSSIVACEGDEVQLELEAQKSTGDVVWTLLDGPGWLSLESDPPRLIGEAMPGEGTVELRVADEEGERDDSLPFEVYEASSGVCQTPGATAPTELLDACVDQPYEHYLVAQGGAGNYEWLAQDTEARPWPEWLTLDLDGKLWGTPPRSAPAVVELTIQVFSPVLIGARFQVVTLPLRVRENCKFGFIGRLGGAARLFLGDVRQGSNAAILEPRELTAGLPDELDVDWFAFSPNGRRIVALARAESDAVASTDEIVVSHVTGLSPPSWQLARASGESWGAVTAATWSYDSERLAVLFTAGEEGTRLVSVDFSGEQPVASAEEPVVVLGDTLFWMGGKACYVGYISRGGGDQDPALFCHPLLEDGNLGAAGITATWLNAFFQVPIQHVGSAEQRFMFWRLEDAFESYYLHDNGSLFWEANHGRAVPDPSLRWIAQPDTELLGVADPPVVRVFPIEPGQLTYAEESSNEIAACHSIQAWEVGGAALACASSSGLRVALLDENGQVSTQYDVENTPDFPNQPRAKAFDAGAGWFVYVTGEGALNAVDLSSTPSRAEELRSALVDGVALTPLSAPGELLVQTGADLHWFNLGERTAPVPLNDGQALNAPSGLCDYENDTSGPSGWCGNPRRPAPYVGDPRGTGVVFPDQQGRLYVVDLERVRGASVAGPPLATAVTEAVVTCRHSDCSASIQFSP
jgi:hypothetical protein